MNNGSNTVDEKNEKSSSLGEFLRAKVLGQIWFIALFIAPAIVLLAFLLSHIGVFENLELKLIDAKFNARPIDSTFRKNPDVVIIAVSDQAQESTRPFPWPRDYHARIIRNLTRAGAKAVAFDLVFDDVDRSGGDAAFREAAAECKNVIVAGRQSTTLSEETRVSFTSLKKVDLQTIFDGTPGASVGIVYVRQDNDGVIRRYHPASINVLGEQMLSLAYASVKTFKNLSDSLKSLDNGNLFEFAGNKFPSFDGQSVLLNCYGPSGTIPQISAENILDDREFMTKIEYEQFKQTMKETGMDSLTVLNSPDLRDLWALDIFDDTLAGIQEQVRGKICIIGPTFPESKDLFPTSMWKDGRPDLNQMYGVEIHATAAQNFLRNDFITIANGSIVLLVLLIVSYFLFGLCVSIKRWRVSSQLLMTIFSGIAALVAISAILALIIYVAGGEPLTYFRSLALPIQLGVGVGVVLLSALIAMLFRRGGSMQEFVSEVSALALTAGAFLIAYQYTIYRFVEDSVLIDVIPIAATASFSYIASIFYQYLTESKQKKLIKGFFNVYVTPALVDQMIANPNIFKLGGERRELTMLFSDIKGFTNISESFKDTPEKLVELLNEYLGTMTEIVFKYGGTLDKYIGDAIVAFWNAPVPVDDHPTQACYAAIEMQETLVKLREKWKAEGKPEIYSRIGINTGVVIVGNMGSQSRFAYTAMGDAMNLAARLEAANKAFKTSIMISEFTRERVKDTCLTRELATITVQGKEQPIKVYELVARKEPGKVYQELAPAETASRGVLAIAKD